MGWKHNNVSYSLTLHVEPIMPEKRGQRTKRQGGWRREPDSLLRRGRDVDRGIGGVGGGIGGPRRRARGQLGRQLGHGAGLERFDDFCFLSDEDSR